MKSIRSAHYSLLIVLLFGIVGEAQVTGNEYAARMAENSEHLRAYTHMRKTEIYWRGKLRSTQFAQIHYDPASGREVSEPLGSTSDNATSHSGPISAMITKKVAGDVKENIGKLVALVGEYLPLNLDKLSAAATRSRTTPALGGGSTIQISDYVQSGDSMALTMSAQSKLTNQVLIASSLEKKPVSIDVEYQSLPNGIVYPSSTVAKWEAKNLEIRISNIEYHK
jgi:hypothetical protein